MVNAYVNGYWYIDNTFSFIYLCLHTGTADVETMRRHQSLQAKTVSTHSRNARLDTSSDSEGDEEPEKQPVRRRKSISLLEEISSSEWKKVNRGSSKLLITITPKFQTQFASSKKTFERSHVLVIAPIYISIFFSMLTHLWLHFEIQSCLWKHSIYHRL